MSFNIKLNEEIKKAEAGDEYSKYNVAYYCIFGDEANTLDPELAELGVRFFKELAEAGDADSMMNLGAIYLQGKAVKKDENEAEKWYRKALETKAPKSYRCLGNFYRYDNLNDGTVVYTCDPERIAKAYECFRQGAELDEENSLYELGDMYRLGLCVEKDEAKAFELYKKAYDIIINVVMRDNCSTNDSYSDVCLRLAECYHHGSGTEVDLTKAREFIDTAHREILRRKAEGDAHGASDLKRVEKEWQEIMAATGF